MKRIATLLATLCLLPGAFAQTITSAVPTSLSYQGRALTSTGALVGAGTPVNRTVTFRIWDHQTNSLTANLIYSEQQTVTIAEGEFSVLVGNGSATTGTPLGYSEASKGKPTVLIGSAFGGASRYLGVTIDDGTAAVDNEISPRQQIVSGAFAFRAKFAEQLGSNGGAALTAVDSGFVGIGNALPPALFTVSGANTSTSTSTPQMILTADDVTERLRIGVDSTGTGTGLLQAFKEGIGAQNLLLNPNGGNVGIGVTNPAVALSVNGAITATGAITGASFTTAGAVTATGAVTGASFGTSAGNIGIGTTTPGTRLEIDDGAVDGTKYGSVQITRPATGHTAAHLSFVRAGTTTMGLGYGQSSSAFGFGPGTVGAFSPSSLAIDTAGKVGIGTTAPTNYLSVEGGGQVATAATTTAVAHFGGGDVHTYFGSYNSVSNYATWMQAMRPSDQLAFPLAINPNGGNVGIGTATPSFKLQVAGSFNSTGDAYVDNSFVMKNDKTFWAANAAGGLEPVFWPRAANNGTYINFGTGGFYIRDNSSNIGVYLIGNKMAVGGTTDTTQGSITANNGFVSVGTGSNGLTSYAKMSFRTDRAAIAFDVYNTGQYPNAWRGFSYDGDNNIDWYSDIRLKKDIVDAEPMLDRLMQVQFRRFRWKDISDPEAKPEFGVIAQEVEPLFPDIIATGTDGMKTVGYTSFATIAAKALQEYKARNDTDLGKLNAQLQEKDARIAALEAKLLAQEKRAVEQADEHAAKEQSFEARLRALEARPSQPASSSAAQ
jgi:hypothetical protein